MRLILFDIFKSKNINYGYSDHSKYGFSEDFLSLLPFILEKKIQYFEKHICRNISRKPPDYISSLELNEFIKFVRVINKYNQLKKFNFSKHSNAEKKYSRKMHKFAFINRN